MKTSTVFRRAITALLATISFAPVFALTVDQAVYDYDSLVRNYNLITFGNASLRSYGDTEAGLAIGGNLYIDGGEVATKATWANGATHSDPTLYVKGSLNVDGTLKLQNGFASTPGVPSGSGWSWSGSSSNRLTRYGSTKLDQINSPSTKANTDPRSASLNPNWDFAALKTQFTEISTTFKNAAVNGKIEIVAQTLKFAPVVPGTEGVVIFDFNANLLVGNRYNGVLFSNVQFDVPLHTNYIVNVRNAHNDTIFGSTAVNFNKGSGYERLLWNIVDASSTTSDTITFGNGGEFFGSILAPKYLVKNTWSTALNGQIVANTFDYTCDELHFTGFVGDLPPAPEPSTYGLIGAASLIGLAGYRRWRSRKAAKA